MRLSPGVQMHFPLTEGAWRPPPGCSGSQVRPDVARHSCQVRQAPGEEALALLIVQKSRDFDDNFFYLMTSYFLYH